MQRLIRFAFIKRKLGEIKIKGLAWQQAPALIEHERGADAFVARAAHLLLARRVA
jgi:hypothetical protein